MNGMIRYPDNTDLSSGHLFGNERALMSHEFPSDKGLSFVICCSNEIQQVNFRNRASVAPQ